jgi:mono/diheme cytochrome c family protein
VTFQPGEIRVCASCHGLNTVDQLGRGAPANAPEALRGMLKFYKSTLRPAPVRKRPVRH